MKQEIIKLYDNYGVPALKIDNCIINSICVPEELSSKEFFVNGMFIRFGSNKICDMVVNSLCARFPQVAWADDTVDIIDGATATFGTLEITYHDMMAGNVKFALKINSKTFVVIDINIY